MKRIKLLYLSLLVICTSPSVMAQYANPLQITKSVTSPINGKINGVVKDSITNNAVEFANVALIDVTTNKPVDGTVCDMDGKFTLSKVEGGEYFLVISFIGYENKKIKVKISEGNNRIELESIILSPKAEMLKEVIVEGKKDLIEEKVDRTIYNAENDATTRGGDATDVLKRVPMLSVDLDGNVSMRGSSNIKVLINNKPSAIAASSVADALKMIPADEIKSVEVITSPSAKYDAEGTGGIINIITKKNTLQGVTLNVDGSAGYRGSNLGLNGSYRKKNMGFSLGGFGRANYNVNGKFENEQKTFINGSETVIGQQASTRNQGMFGRYNLGWDYDINKKNSLAASVRYGLRNQNTYQDNFRTATNDIQSSLGNVNTKDNSGTVDASLTYTHLYDTPQREFNLMGLYSRNNRTNNYFNSTHYDFNDSTGLRKNLNQSYNQEITIQADYQTPIGTTQMLEFGGKEIARKVSSDYQYFVNDTDGSYKRSTQPSNVFDYTQNITAGYLSYTLNFLKSYSLKAGARYEYTNISADFHKQQDGPSVNNIPSYGVLVPSINFSKKLKKGNMIKWAYNRRIQRPSIQFLNPSIQNSNNLNYSQGNPNLHPEYTNNYEMSYSTYIKGSSLSFSGFMRNTNNSIQSIRDTLSTGGILTTYKNIGKEDAYGVNIFANINVGNKFSLNGGTDIYYAVLKNNVPDPRYNASNQGWVISGRIFGSYNFTKTWGVQFFSFYRGRQVQLQGTQSGFGIYSLSLKKDFNEKKGSIGFGAENFFTPAFKIRSESRSPILAQNSTTTFHNMNFKVTFSYRIGKMSFDQPRRRKSISNDDLKEGGGENPGNTSGAPQQSAQQGPANFRSGQGQQKGKAPVKEQEKKKKRKKEDKKEDEKKPE